jgi:hypothetical protein
MAVRDLLTVTLRAKTYRNPRKGFKFPSELYRAFGFHGGSKVALLVTDVAGNVLFSGISTFIHTGPEITQAATVKNLDFDQEIRILASRTP